MDDYEDTFTQYEDASAHYVSEDVFEESSASAFLY